MEQARGNHVCHFAEPNGIISCHVFTSSRSRCPSDFRLPFPLPLHRNKHIHYKFSPQADLPVQEVDTYGPGGHVDSTFEYNDRGRGPKIAAHYILGENSSSAATTEITGNDYLKAPVDERFILENGIGTWKSTSENGHAPGPGFYISNNGPAAESAFPSSRAAESQGPPLKLFPAGEARLEKMTDVTLEKQRPEAARNRICDHRAFI